MQTVLNIFGKTGGNVLLLIIRNFERVDEPKS